MKKLNKKVLNVMATAALVASVAAPFSVSANSTNVVTKTPSVDDDFTSGATAPTALKIEEDDVAFQNGDVFRLELPSGVEWTDGKFTVNDVVYNSNVYNTLPSPAAPYFKVVSVTDQTLELSIEGFDNGGITTKEFATIPMFFDVDGADGEVKVTVDGRNSTVTSGQYTIAYVSGGKTTATIGEAKTIGDSGSIDTIRIDETAIGALYDTSDLTQEITLKLPSKFDWSTTYAGTATDPRPTITLGSGFTKAGAIVNVLKADGTSAGTDLVGNVLTLNNPADYMDGTDTLQFSIQFSNTVKPDAPGTIYLANLKLDADSDAPYGDVEVNVDGDKVTNQDLVIAKYSDYGAAIATDGDVPTLISGRNNEDENDLELVELEVKETVANSWFENRSVKFEFPTWVKVVGADITEEKGFDGTTVQSVLTADIVGDSNEVEFDLPSSNSNAKKSFKVKFYVSSEADAEGDITAKVSGRAGIEGEVVLGKVVKPVSVEIASTDVKVGVKDQAVSDIIITEADKGAFLDNKEVRIWLGDGEFSGTPKVEVVEGNLEIDEDSIEVTNGVLTFNIDNESTKASKIKISDVKLDLYRDVPEGNISVKVGGTALVQNDEAVDNNTVSDAAFTDRNNTIGDKSYPTAGTPAVSAYALDGIDVGEFDKDYVVKTTIAKVVTPADGNVKATAVFTIDSPTYSVNGVEKTADVAPFIKDGRTFMPIRFVAEAAGVTENNIIWDANSKTVTLIKGDRIAQVKIGSNILTVNGVAVQMDTAAFVKDGRTVLPLSFVAKALGGDVKWDEATRTVTIN